MIIIQSAEPDQSQTRAAPDPKYVIFSLFFHEWASYSRYEALDWCILKEISSSIDL